MTVLWTALIMAGVVMILVAVWPSIRPARKRDTDDQDRG